MGFSLVLDLSPAAPPRSARPGRPQPLGFAEFLVARAAITEEQLLDVLAEHWATRRRVGEALLRRGYLTATDYDRWSGEYHAAHLHVR